MLDLAKEGLVEAVRNKGFRVTEMSDSDLDDITEIRRLIEVPTVAKLAESGRDAEFERLRPLAREIVTAAERGDLLTYVERRPAFPRRAAGPGGQRLTWSRWSANCAAGPASTG